jgi:hypothetical protein
VFQPRSVSVDAVGNRMAGGGRGGISISVLKSMRLISDTGVTRDVMGRAIFFGWSRAV